MLEMTYARKYHRHAVFIGCLDGLLVAYGAANLDNSRHTTLGRQFYGIWKRYESIRTHDAAFRPVPGTLKGDLCADRAIGLSRPHTHQSIILDEGDTVGLDMLDRPPCEEKVIPFFV